MITPRSPKYALRAKDVELSPKGLAARLRLLEIENEAMRKQVAHLADEVQRMSERPVQPYVVPNFSNSRI